MNRVTIVLVDLFLQVVLVLIERSRAVEDFLQEAARAVHICPFALLAIISENERSQDV
jgi:hypothetical protein